MSQLCAAAGGIKAEGDGNVLGVGSGYHPAPDEGLQITLCDLGLKLQGAGTLRQRVVNAIGRIGDPANPKNTEDHAQEERQDQSKFHRCGAIVIMKAALSGHGCSRFPED